MIRPEVVRRRLAKLDECLSILHTLRRYSLQVFLADPEHYGSAERFLQVAIETITDLGNHVIAELGLGVVDRYSDIPALLARHGYIDAQTEEMWVRMIGFRNILVHGYLEVDRRIVYDAVQHRLADLAVLGRVFARLL